MREQEQQVKRTWAYLRCRPRPLSLEEATGFIRVAGFSVTVRHLRQWVESGQLQPEHRTGSFYLLAKTSLERCCSLAIEEGLEMRDSDKPTARGRIPSCQE